MLINRALRADQIVEQDDSDFEGFDLEAMTKRLRDIMALPHGADEAGRRERLQEIMKLDLSIDAYRQFLRDKVVMSKDLGFHIEPGQVNPILKPHTVRRRGCPDDYRTADGRIGLYGGVGNIKTAERRKNAFHNCS